MNCWGSFYMQVLQEQNLLIKEQNNNEPNPLYALANTAQHVTQLNKAAVRTGQAGAWGSILVKTLCYKSEGPGIDSKW